ncbi:nucleolar protein 8 isoform X3 [Diceros bicornis minor]|uniref:nucleolar protein 8 isoform X3 n=1 Tax=Diceros bicornis minor TaxID=77932 RepID=UPI0026EA3941|nr:nucleolar protein 8 isoform X3 [Diceros bicornis minor]
MKANRETKRLFVGGLGRNISEADLQNQFSRFGEVSDVEIITRKDDQGNPQKVFAYINIRVTETDLKKCMSVLNKTKWKGGTLQIQLAKESFLHRSVSILNTLFQLSVRLAQEREEAKAKKQKSTTGNTSLLEKMGVVDFHVKAVPGTEVPGHKNWIVSKFGRVLPVLHLKNQHKRKIIKYDPSKYCHNLKKIGEDFTNATPVSNLTWELEGGNDPMSKKRRGEFSDFHSPPKKMITVQKDEGSIASLAMRLRPSRIMESLHLTQQQAAQETPYDPITPPKSPWVPDSESQKLKNVFSQTSGLETTRNRNSMSDGIDSEDELRLLIAREENLGRTTWSSVNESENDPFEVVRDDFKSDVHKLHSLTGLGIKNSVSCLDSEDNVMGNDCDYDSGDTDEIIAMKKNAGKVKNSAEFSQMEKSMHKKSLKNRKKREPSDHRIKVQKGKTNVELAISHGVKLSCKSLSDFSSSEDADSVSELAKAKGDEYNAMMKSCLHVNLTLADLEQLAGSDLEAPKEDTEGDGWETTAKCDRASKSRRIPSGLHRGQQCIHPEEIVASLLEGEENTHGKQKPKENNVKSKFQAFKGVGCLYGKELVKKSLKDGHPEDKPTHIIFASDSESETKEASTQEQSHLGEEPVKESMGRASGKLFDSCDDEESGSEDDSNRFRIKPQFQGRAGQKLMDLQSHFGTDDRFRMDSRFLESDSEEEQEEVNEKKTAEEEELAAEKLKALNVVQSVLHINLSNSTSKGSVAAKKFKDIIRYDPTRHDHATYERKRDDKPKESKAKRKKKREETEKLPEVSKEMYYDIATDLKEIFQTTKDTSEKEDAGPWNEDYGGEKAEEVHDRAAVTTGAGQPGGFTFSFFDSDSKDVKEETYRVETVKPGKIAWQGAPRFQDSSSEEEDVTEETDDRKPSPGEVSLPEKETTRFFFFSKNDERLHGSDLFWRGVGSNISRNSWEARTNNLRMDCRKKHKDAKRRMKPK